MPVMSGLDVMETLRAEGSRLPTIILTAKGSEEDRILGLELGADDYVTKPFAIRELVARVSAQVRRTRRDRGDGDAFEIHGVTFDLGRLSGKRGDEEILLTPREGEILSYLRSHKGNIVTRDEFLLEVWKYPTANVETRTVDNTLAALRKKIEANPAEPQIIKTVRGKGYRWGA
jgi:DNA-binding response OmpR family regulator